MLSGVEEIVNHLVAHHPSVPLVAASESDGMGRGPSPGHQSPALRRFEGVG